MCCTWNTKYFIMLQLSCFSDCQVYSAQDALRQDNNRDKLKKMTGNPGSATQSARGAAGRFSPKNPHMKFRKIRRTTPEFISRPHDCDYMAKPCLHAYVTGKICAKTVYFRYQTFDTYCLMEYVNCREAYDVWQIAHTGACFDLQPVDDHMIYGYHDDFFLDNYYIVNDRMID